MNFKMPRITQSHITWVNSLFNDHLKFVGERSINSKDNTVEYEEGWSDKIIADEVNKLGIDSKPLFTERVTEYRRNHFGDTKEEKKVVAQRPISYWSLKKEIEELREKNKTLEEKINEHENKISDLIREVSMMEDLATSPATQIDMAVKAIKLKNAFSGRTLK